MNAKSRRLPGGIFFCSLSRGKEKQLLDGFHPFDIGEKLSDGAFYPAV